MTNVIDFANDILGIDLDSRQTILLKRFYNLPLTLEESNNVQSQSDYKLFMNKRIQSKCYE
jgi:hypothetical protein